MKRPHIAKLIEIPGRDPFFIQSLDALVDRDIQSTPDNSNIQGKLGKSSSDREFELSRVKLYRKLSEGKWKLLRVEVRIIEGSRYRKSTVRIFIPSQELEYTLQSSKLPPYVINHFSRFGIIEYSHLGFFNVCLRKKISLTLMHGIYPGSYSAPLFCTLALATLTNIF